MKIPDVLRAQTQRILMDHIDRKSVLAKAREKRQQMRDTSDKFDEISACK